MKKAFIIIISLMTFVLVGCTKPTNESVINDLKNDDYKNFASDYEQLSTDEQINVSIVVGDEVGDIIFEFIAGDRSEESLNEAIGKLSLIGKSNEFEDLCNLSIIKLKEIHGSNLAFEFFEEWIKDYEYDYDYEFEYDYD